MPSDGDNYDSDIRHGYCIQCDSPLGVARVDGVEHLVCHCTGVDAEYGPQPLDGTGGYPLSWEWRVNGRDPVTRVETEPMLCCMGCGESVRRSEAFRQANGSPRCPGCASDKMDPWEADS